MFKKLINSPVLKLLVGIILLYTSGTEVWRDLHSIDDVSLGAHHGVLLFAIVNIMQTLPDLMEGLSAIHESRE